MDSKTKKQFDNLHADTADIRNEAFNYIMTVTENPVNWAPEVWDSLMEQLRHRNNHRRDIAAQILSNLAKSEPDLMLSDLDKLLKVTRDERLITARHALQSLWKVAAAGKELQAKVIDYLIERFNNCITEDNYTLIRYNIIGVFRKLYEVTQNENVRLLALQLIATEENLKSKKRYSGLWRDTF